MGAASASEYVLNVLFLVHKEWTGRARLATTAFLLAVATLLTGAWPWLIPCIAMLCVATDIGRVLLSRPPVGDFVWRRDRYGMDVGVQASHYRRHVVVTGGVSLAAYSTGLLHAVFERYGAEAFHDFDFIGASSGSWVAACAVVAANGCLDMRYLFELVFVTACQLTELFPFGLLFIGCHAVEELTAWAVRISEVHWRAAHDAVVREGKLATWLFGCSLLRLDSFPRARPGLSRCMYRLVVRAGGDLQRSERIGSLIAATSVFPYFTHPCLCSRLVCAPAVMDGYFPGKGCRFLPVPDIVLPAEGSVLLIDMSGGMEELYAGEKRIQAHSLHNVDMRCWVDDLVQRHRMADSFLHNTLSLYPLPLFLLSVVSIHTWRNFVFQDWAASSPEAFRRLFECGVQDAESRTEELDRKLFEAFGLRPKEQQ